MAILYRGLWIFNKSWRKSMFAFFPGLKKTMLAENMGIEILT